MPYLTYKFIHVAAILILFLTIGGLSALSQGSKTRKIYAMVNGLTLLTIFVAGFGLMARLQVAFPWPAWIWLKLAGWFIVGMAPKFTKTWSPLIILSFYASIGVAMAYLALYKPF